MTVFLRVILTWMLGILMVLGVTLIFFYGLLSVKEVKFRSLHEYVALQFKGHPVAVDRAYLRIRQGKLVLGYEKISTIGTEPSEGLSLGRSRLVFSLLGLIRGNFFPEALELDDTVIVVNRQFSGDTEVSLHRWKEEDGATTQASQYLTSNAEFAFVIPKNASEAGQGLSLPEALGFSTFPILRTENTRVFLFDEVSSQNYRFHAHVLTVETVGGVLKLNVLTTIDLGDAVPSVQSPLQLLVDGELLIDPTAYVVAYNGELVARGVDALFARSSASEQTSNGPARAGEASVLPTMGREYSLDMTGVYLGQSQSIRVEAALKADQQALCQLQLNNTGILSITELLRQDAAGATQDPAARLRADAQVLEASDRVDIANPENNVGNFDQALEYATADQGETDQGILSDADDAPAAPAARDAPEAPDEALADADEADAAPDAPDAPDAPAPAAPAAPDEADASPDAPGTHGAPAPAESDAAQATEATEARQAIHSVITASFTQCDMPALVRLASANLPPDFQAFGQMNADLQVVLSSTESVFPLDESPSRVPVLGRWQPLATKLAWHSDRITVESPTIWAEKQVGFDQIGGEAIMNFAEAALSVTSKNTTDNGTELHVNLQSTAAEIDWKEISNAFHASQLIPSLDSAETPSQYSGLPQRSVADRVAATLGEAPATPATPAADQLAQALQRMTLAFSAPTLNPRDVKTLWPVVLQPKARTWITSNVTAYQAEDFALTAAVAIEFPQPSDNTASDNAGSDNAGSDNASPDSAPRRASRAEAQSPNKATPLVTQAADATADASSTAFPLSLPNGQKALEESAYATPSLPKDKSYTLRGDAVEVGISNIAGSWEMSNARVRFSAGLPPITDVHGNVDFNGAGLLFRIDNARHNAIRLFPDAGHHLLVRPITTAELADLDRQEYRDALGNWVGKLPFFLEIDATMKAPLPTLLAVADSPAYQLLTPRGVPWQGLRGNADTRLRLQFPLFGDLAGHEITFDVLADIYEFSFLDSPVLEIDVYAEHLPVSLNNQEARVEGAAITLDGEPALIRWEEDFVADTQRTVLIETAVNPATIARHLGDEAVQFGGIVGDAMVFVTATQQRGEPGHRATFDVTLDPVAWEIASIPIARKVTGDRAYLNATFTQQPIAMEGTFAVPTHSQGQFRVVFDEQRFAGVTLDSQVPASVFGEWLLNSSDLLSGTIDLTTNLSLNRSFFNAFVDRTVTVTADSSASNLPELLLPFIVPASDAIVSKQAGTRRVQPDLVFEAVFRDAALGTGEIGVELSMAWDKTPLTTLKGRYADEAFTDLSGSISLPSSALLEVLPSDIASEIQLVGQMPARVLVSQHKENTTNSAFQREGWAVDLDFDLAQTAFDFALYPLANFEANNNGTMRVNAFFATNEDTPTIDVKTVLAVPSSAIAADIAMQLSRLSLVSAKANVRRWAGNVFSVRYIDRPPKTDAPQPNNDEAQAAQAAQSGQEGQGEQQPSAPPESSSGAQAASNAAIPPSLQDTPTNIVLAADSTVVGLTEPQLAFMNDAPNLLSSSQRQQVYPRYEVTATTLDARPFLETETTGGILFEAFVDPFDNVFLSAEQVQVHRHLILHDVQGEILRTTPTEQTVQARARYSTESQPGRLHGWGIMTPYTDTLRIYADDFGLLTRELQFSDRYTGGTTEIIGQRHATNLHWSGFGEITDISTKDFSLLIRLQEAISIVGLWNSLASSDWNVKRVGGTFACRAEDCLVDDLRVESNSISLIASGSWSEDATDISGTIVPQTVWDNALRAIPVVGKLIVGGEDDGFLGVAFQITANESGDKVALNPLTAIEPGILRLIREGSAQSSSNNRGERASTAPSAAAQ